MPYPQRAIDVPSMYAIEQATHPDSLALLDWLDLAKPDYGPEQRLCAAILEDARNWVVKRTGSINGGHKEDVERAKELEVERAKRWILSDDRSWPFSFENICDALGLEPSWVRKRILGGRP